MSWLNPIKRRLGIKTARNPITRPRPRMGLERLDDRLVPAGGLDPVFDGNGTATLDFGATDTARAVVVQPDGKVVVAGSLDSGSSNFAVARFNPDGTPDLTFSGDGRADV